MPRSSPAELIRRFVAAALFLVLASAASRPGRAQEVSLAGWLTYEWSDHADGTPGDLALFLSTADAPRRRLLPAPGAEPGYVQFRPLLGQRVTVRGVETQARDEGQPSDIVFDLIAPEGAARPALSSGPLLSGSQTFVTILCRAADRTGITTAPLSYFAGLATGSEEHEMDHYWRELSYDQVNLAGSAAAGWFDLPQAESYYAPSGQIDTARLFTDCTRAADGSVDFTQFGGVNVVLNGAAGSPAYGGGFSATLDGVRRVWRATWMPSWARHPGVWGHEIGHSFGFPHSGTAAGPYTSQWDVMSGSVGPATKYGSGAQHTISAHKDSTGWLPASKIVQVNPGESASVTLERMARPVTESPQMVKIPANAFGSRFFTAEARLRAGYDSQIPGEGVIIHEVIPGRTNPANVVDGDGNTTPNDGGAVWEPGETYVDAASGIRISVIGRTPSGFTIAVLNGGTQPLIGFRTLAGTAGAAGHVDATGSAARFNFPGAIALDASGTAFVADQSNGRIRRVTPGGAVTTFGSPVESCGFCLPSGLALDSGGSLHVASSAGNNISRVAPDGTVTLYAGGRFTSGTQDGTGAAARFRSPRGIAFDAAGNLYVADSGNHTIRKIAPGGVTTTVAGTPGTAGFADGAGTTARFNVPTGIAVGADGNVYIVDQSNYAVRRMTPAGAVTTVAGNGSALHQDGTGSAGRFVFPTAIAATPAGQLLVTDYYTVRSLTSGGVLTTIAGGYYGTGSQDGIGDAARFTGPAGVAATAAGVIVVADTQNHTIRVSYDTSVLSLRPGVLHFGATKAGPAGALLAVTPEQSFIVSPPDGAAWTASVDQPWVRLSRGSGTGTGTIAVGIVNDGNVLGGSTVVTANVRVTSQNLVRNLLVRLVVQQVPDTSAAPTGAVDTPVQNATGLSGSIGVTGWAMDDVAVAAVKIYRNCLGGIDVPQNCQIVAGQPVVYIGDAAFLAGARPDVEALFPDNPQAYRAGWGYLMLTNMLPHIPLGRPGSGGQGTFTLSAVAIDAEGRQTLLGTRTVTLDNDNAARPFGAIDTPVQGGTVSGTLANFGWALTPGTAIIPTNGSTMVVFLDGQPVSTVAYNQCRGTVGNPAPAGTCNDDIATLFPGYSNITQGGGAIGAYVIDTTKLSNGLHTIAWSVTDNAGRTEGIGSRFFNVLNGSARASRPAAGVAGRAALLEGFTPWSGTLGVRTGFDLAAPFGPLEASGGAADAAVAELGRVELELPGTDVGYLVVNGELRPLPQGSSLDSAAGRFAWSPPVGYVGRYELLFTGAGRRVSISLTVGPAR